MEEACFDATDCIIAGNSAAEEGGGIHFEIGPLATLRNTQVTGNTAGTSGGGIYADGFEPPIVGTRNGDPVTIDSCVISGNTAGADGGAVYSLEIELNLVNSQVTGNFAQTGAGGALYLTDHPLGPVLFLNSTVAFNQSALPGEIYVDYADPQHRNISLGFRNTALSSTPVGPFGGLLGRTNTEFSNSPAAGMSDFVDPIALTDAPTTAGDFRPATGSSLIDAGANDLALGLATDLPGNSRQVGPSVDVGAYEFEACNFDQDLDNLPDDYEMANTSPASAIALDPLDDSDGDDIPVWMEFAIGGSLTAPDVLPEPRIEVVEVDGLPYFGLSFLRNPAAPGFVEWIVESSPDLGESIPWSTDGTTTRDLALEGILERVTSSRTSDIGSEPDGHLRLQLRRANYAK